MWDFYLPILAIPVARFTQWIVIRSTRNASGSLHDSIQNLRAQTWGLAIATIYLWFCLPKTPSLSTFGRPEVVSDIASPDQLFKQFVEYNVAICQTSNVLLCFFILFAVWLQGSVIKLLNAWNDLGGILPNPEEKSD